MKKYKYMILCLILVSALLLGGCQLALDEQEYARDRLVGMSVRLGEGWRIREENMQSGVNRYEPHEPDGQVMRLNTHTDELGNIYRHAEYDADGWFEPVKLHIHTKDDGEEYTLETTIYAVEEMLPDEPYLQMERVYEREDGTLYALAGGNNYAGNLDGLGLTISENYSQTDTNGEKTTFGVTLKLNVKYEKKILSAEAVEMKGTGEELARHTLGEQEEIWVSPEAEWLLIEETLSDGSIRRSAVNGPLNKETFFVRFPTDEGVCPRKTYTIRTPGALTGEGTQY